MHFPPSVPWCSESSWHWPEALQLGLRPENDVLPLLSRPVWHLAHGTSLWRLTSGNEPLMPWASSISGFFLVSLLPPFLWHIRHCELLYLPSDFERFTFNPNKECKSCHVQIGRASC